MGRKRTRGRKLIHFCVASLIWLTSFGWAVLTENQSKQLKVDIGKEKREKAKGKGAAGLIGCENSTIKNAR